MPYINPLQRNLILSGDEKPENAGELNFAITTLCINYLSRPTSYQQMNDVLGALEGAKLEFYARVVRPYEDEKIKQNGDIY